MSAITDTSSLCSIGEKSFAIKEGYKKTKLGWIPEEWETPNIDEVFEYLNTNSFSRNQLNYEEEEGVYNIHYGDIHATYKRPILDFEREKRVPKINKEIVLSDNAAFLKSGDLIIADASEDYEGVGAAIELKNVNDRKVVGGLHTFVFRDRNNKTADGFRVYIFRSPLVKKALKIIATGSKVYGLSKSNILKFRIVLPPLPEQQKIAAILATWDRAIAKQQQLIAAKQEYKKGLMELLLTGKLRFEGFEGEWEEIILGKYCTMYSGGTPSRAVKEFYGGNIPWIKSGELNQGLVVTVEERITDLALKNSSAKIVEKGTLLLALYGATAGVVAITDIRGAINQAILAIETNEQLNKLFLYYLLKIKMPRYLENLVQGGQPNLNGGMIKKLKIKRPPEKEQQKIASALSVADAEITLLENELVRMREQKRGLMQGLLTGEVRVKV